MSKRIRPVKPEPLAMTIDDDPASPQAGIVSQAVIVITVVERDGKRGMSVRSFGSPEGPSHEAETFADTILKAVAAIIQAGADGWDDPEGKP